MTPITHLAGVVLGIAAAAGITFWSASDNGPRGKNHYARIAAQQPLSTRDVIMGFEQMGIEQRRPADAIRKYFAPDVIEHDPRVAGTRQSVIDYLESRGWSGKGPERIIHNIIVEGELGIVHHHIKLTPDSPGIAAVDIFRVRNGKVIEHWDVLQPLPEDSPNKNGPF